MVYCEIINSLIIGTNKKNGGHAVSYIILHEYGRNINAHFFNGRRIRKKREIVLHPMCIPNLHFYNDNNNMKAFQKK